MTPTPISMNGRASDRILTDSYRFCRKVVTGHSENFPVGSLLAPAVQRRWLHAIYAFARLADDFADEGDLSPARRLQEIQDWQRMLDDCFEGRTSHPVFVALADTVHRLHLPKRPFDDLLCAFRMDVTKSRYATFEELLSYCQRSANPVGRLVLRVFGFASEYHDELSDHLCTALQLANFWQDVGPDLHKGRVYIPLEDVERFGYTENDLNSRIVDERFRSLMAFQVARTRSLFASAAPLLSAVGGRFGLELSLTWRGGMTILDKIEHGGYDMFAHRPRITTRDKIHILFTARSRNLR